MSHNSPPVTIAIPFYNPGPALLDAVKSVYAQTYQNWELLLVDDGSTDGSLEIANSIRDPRVRVFSDGKNRRLGARLNEITGLAKYEFVARMDADDLMARCRIERQMEILLRKPEINLVATGVLSLNDHCEPVGRRCVSTDHQITPRGLLAGQSGIVHASVLSRKNWLQRNPYREDLPLIEDTNLWMRAFSKNDLKAYIIPEPLYFYREDGSVTLPKLMRAYRNSLTSIREDANQNFPLMERLRAEGAYLSKIAIAFFLAQLGKLDIIRERRNSLSLSADDANIALAEIQAIQGTQLPIFS